MLSDDSNATLIPLFLRVEHQRRYDDDVMEHEVSFQVAGAPDTEVVATVSSHFFEKPKVTAVTQHGVLNLAAEVVNGLLIITFRLLTPEMNTDGGWETSWSIPDASEWIRCQCPSEAEYILLELRRHVRAGVRVQNSRSVTIG